ncbi:MAG: hypothetical protein AABX30_02055 [Nanoarchaeota archaeon]
MVKILEGSIAEIPYIAKQRISDEELKYEQSSAGYSCDCDGFGGGDPPCDCNK